MNTSVNGFYSGGPRVSQTRQISDPQYLKSNTFSQQLNSHTYVYFLAQKLNNSQLKYNQRFFMLTDNTSFGYSSKFKVRPIPFMDSKLLYDLKRDIPLEDITFPHDTDPVIMNVKYTERDGEKVMLWKVRFGSQRMRQVMLEKLLTAQKERIEEIHNPKGGEGSMMPRGLDVIREMDEGEEKTERENKRKEKERKEKEEKDEKEKQKLNRDNQNPEQFVGSQNNPPLSSSNHPTPQFLSQSSTSVAQSKIIRIQSKQKLKQSLFMKSLQPNTLNIELKIPHYKYNYQFLKESQEIRVIPEFKEQALKLVTKIIDQLCLFSSRRTYRPIETLEQGIFVYQVGGFLIKMGFNKSQVNKQTKVRRYKLGGVGLIYQQFENYDYLLQVTRNKGNIRVPLTCLITYKGFVSLVKVQIPTKPLQTSSILKIKKPLQSLAIRSRIDPSIFEDHDNIQIAQLNPQYFQEFAQIEKEEMNSHFYRSMAEIFYVNEVKHFLPKDIRYRTDDLKDKMLRPEFINREQYQNVLFTGLDITKLNEEENKDELGTLSSASKDLESLAKLLSDELSSLQTVPLSTFDLQSLFHSKGLNLRYIWLVYQSTPISFIRKLTHTYACIKTISILLNCKFQDLIREWIQLSPFKNQPDEQIKQSNLILRQTIVTFINSVFGESHVNDSIRMLNQHMVEFYGIKFLRADILPGFLIQGISEQSGVEIKWPNKRPKSFLWKDAILTIHDVKEIIPKVETYSMKYTSLYQELEELVSDKDVDNMLKIENLIHLKSNGIPSHLKESYLYGPLLEYLSTYIKPPSLNPHLRASSVYGPVDNLWASSSFSVKVSQIKWLLMENMQQSAFTSINKLINQLKRRTEDNHPVEGQIYILLSQYYFQKNNLKQAEKYGLECVRIIDIVVNPTHLKKIDIYSQLAEIYLRNRNYEQTLKYLQMVKYIIQLKNKKENNQYAELLIKISKCQMQMKQYEQGISTIQKAIQLYEQVLLDEQYQSSTIDAYEILYQLYQLTNSKQNLLSLSEYCSKVLPDIKQPDNFQKLLKIIIFPLLSNTDRSCSRKFIHLIQSIIQTDKVQQHEGQSLQYLKFIIQENDLMDAITTYIEHIDQMYVYVNDENSIRKWRGLSGKNEGDIMEFISLIAAIIGCVGKGDLVEVLGKQDIQEERREISRKESIKRKEKSVKGKGKYE